MKKVVLWQLKKSHNFKSDTAKGRGASQKNLNKLEVLVHKNFMKFSMQGVY